MKNLTIKTTLTFINVFFLALVALAQGSIEGTIKDEFTKELMPFVNVALEQDGEIIKSGTTDYEGFFYFDNIKEGNYEVVIRMFDNMKTYTDIYIKDETALYAFDFNPATEIPVTTATGHRNLITKEHIQIIEASFIDEIGAQNIKDIETIMPAAIQTPEGISYKGARPGTAVYYIDGIRTYGDLYVPMSSVGSIEVYSGGIPAQYGNTTSAVIVVESKSYFDKL